MGAVEVERFLVYLANELHVSNAIGIRYCRLPEENNNSQPDPSILFRRLTFEITGLCGFSRRPGGLIDYATIVRAHNQTIGVVLQLFDLDD